MELIALAGLIPLALAVMVAGTYLVKAKRAEARIKHQLKKLGRPPEMPEPFRRVAGKDDAEQIEHVAEQVADGSPPEGDKPERVASGTQT